MLGQDFIITFHFDDKWANLLQNQHQFCSFGDFSLHYLTIYLKIFACSSKYIMSKCSNFQRQGNMIWQGTFRKGLQILKLHIIEAMNATNGQKYCIKQVRLMKDWEMIVFEALQGEVWWPILLLCEWKKVNREFRLQVV